MEPDRAPGASASKFGSMFTSHRAANRHWHGLQGQYYDDSDSDKRADVRKGPGPGHWQQPRAGVLAA